VWNPAFQWNQECAVVLSLKLYFFRVFFLFSRDNHNMNMPFFSENVENYIKNVKLVYRNVEL